ncbi:BnaCnng75640D, partial [Brassica napus]
CEVKSVIVSPFRKLVEIVEKPPFSRCFGWFLMSRHLKISKKHEGNSNGIGDDTVPLPDEYTTEEAPVGAEDASGVGEDMIDVNMTAVNNLNEPSSTGVVNNPTSPLVDCDANTVMTVDRCDKQFLTRAWEAHVTALCSSPNNDYAAKFRSLSEKLKSPFDINVGGLSLESRELSLIIERSSHLSAKV